MSGIELVIEERATDIGNFRVGRLLPSRLKRSVGPFVFIDHIGPVTMNGQENLDVLPHPHIGLSTLTYLLEGKILHRDSLGNEAEIRPGAVNWMTAGKGVVHSERTPAYLRHATKSLHGLQVWVALPAALEETDPSFTQVEDQDIPSWEQDGLLFKLIAGEAWGRKSPVPVHSRLYFMEIKSSSPCQLVLDRDVYGERALYLPEGKISSEGVTYGPNQLLVAKADTLVEFDMAADTTVFVFGGEPFPEKRLMDWNFVSTNRERLQQAKEDWINQRFPLIKGETEFVPYPVPY
jgi:redox-sensitive bicupin YhaK (pirin superfamily)